MSHVMFLFNHYNTCRKFEPDKNVKEIATLFLSHEAIEHDFLSNSDPRDSITWLF